MPIDRVPEQTQRQRRIIQDIDDLSAFIDPDNLIDVNEEGFLDLKLGANSGLINIGGELFINVLSTGGLQLDSNFISILLDPAGEDLLVTTAAGLNVDEDELYSFVTYYN